MRKGIIFSVLIGVGIMAALATGSWYLIHNRGEKVCPLSGRPIHPQTRALAIIGRKKAETCCVRCAIVDAQQTGKPLRLLRVANFETGQWIDPAHAWFVEGSEVDLCTRMSPEATGTGTGTVYLRSFDRCSPSILAFPNEKSARAFIAQHGGVLERIDDLINEAKSPAGKVQRP